MFNIRLGATPTASDSFSNWKRVDFIDDMKQDPSQRRPSNAENFEIRYRVPDRTKP